MVIAFVHQVNGDPAPGIARGDDGSMYMHAVHALATMGGKQGRVYVQDASAVGIDQVVGDFP
jgi:hypothetical protein